MSIEKALGKLRAAQMCHPNAVQALIDEAIAAIQQAEAQQPATGERLMGQVSLPDGSAFAIASFPLPKDHWLYAPREYATGAGEPLELPAPILTHGQREAVVAAIRYAVRGATMCGREQDFDPDAMVQNAVYALCGPYARVSAENTQTSVNLALSQQPATPEPVCGAQNAESAPQAPLSLTAAPQQAEVTDAQILEVAEPFGAFQYGDAQGDKRIDFARAILALRPERVPMTDEQISLEAHNADDRDWNDLRFRSSWHEGFLEGARFVEAHHGITAQAKKETP